jgi:hypothetical protein
MSAFQTAYERNDQAKPIRAAWVFAAKTLIALALVLTATIAVVRTEVLAGVQQLENADPPLILQ